MSKPIVLLDVDGVLNPLRSKVESADWVFEPPFFSTPESGFFSLRLSRQMGDAVASLDCEIRWLTSWIKDEDHANDNIGAFFGWGRKRVCSLVFQGENGEFFDFLWKIRSVKNVLTFPGPPVIWIDDESLCLERELGISRQELDPHNRLLVVAPQSSVGLTARDISSIKDFLASKGYNFNL